MQDSTNGWVTFQKIPLHDGRVIVVQKNDGQTRVRVLQRPAGCRVDPAENGHI
jgi:hypothetical protein